MHLVLFAMLSCLTLFAGKPAFAQAAQTVEQAIQDAAPLDPPANDPNASDPNAGEPATPSRKLFQPRAGLSAASTKKSSKKSSKDFVAAHSAKAARKPVRTLSAPAPKKSEPTVQSDDLMSAMRDGLNPQPAAPAAEATATTSAVPAAPSEQVLNPMPSGKLFHPTAKTAPTDINAGANTLPDVTPKTPAPASTAAPKPAAAPAAPTATIDAPSKEVKKEEPKKDTAKTGAPLLSDLNEAPTGAEDVKGDVAAPAVESKPQPKAEAAPTPAAEPAKPENEGFSAPRPLFSALNDTRKRPGIKRVVRTEAFAPAPASLPPVTPATTQSVAAEKEPMIKPVASETAVAENPEKKSIWGAPNPEMTKGKVLFSQSADGSVPEPKDVSEVKPVDVKTPEAKNEEAKATEPAAGEPTNIGPEVHALCGPANGSDVEAAPTTNLCAQGKATSVIGSGPFMWSCQDTESDNVVNCSANYMVVGVCGSANGVATSKAPTSNLCSSGKPSGASGTGPFVWVCAGEGSGMSAHCQAPLLTANNQNDIKAAEPVAADASTAKAGNECTPTVKRWTITCQQGGYPSNYTGMIVGETQTLCPMNVERGVWLSNNCAASTGSIAVSKSPGMLEVPAPKRKVVDALPPMSPLAADKLDMPRKLFTPHFKRGAGEKVEEEVTTISFAPKSEGLDGQATSILESMIGSLRADEKSIITLNAYAAVGQDGDQQESRRIALARALAARSYLMRKGIPSSRIDVRAIGPASDAHGDDRVDIKVK